MIGEKTPENIAPPGNRFEAWRFERENVVLERLVQILAFECYYSYLLSNNSPN
jgi:hypothetical protein